MQWLARSALILLFGAAACGEDSADAEAVRHVDARVQTRLGGPVEETRMAVHPVPVDPRRVPASEAGLADDELVLGVEVAGRPVAYPVRYLALYEVVNDRVGDTPLAPTW